MEESLNSLCEFKREGLTINKVPKRTRRDFVNLAHSEFEGHYGMALREILDFYFEYKLLKQLLRSSNIDLTKFLKEAKK